MTVNFPTNPPGSMGWVCPKCGSVYAPWVATCFNCKQVVKYSVTTTPRSDIMLCNNASPYTEFK